MSNNQSIEETIKEARQEVRNIIIHLLDKDVDINTILSVLTVNRWELEELKSVRTVEINSENKKDTISVNKTYKPKIKARRITKLPDDYQSPLSRENERLLKLLRNL